ncbi:hypothetical protein TSTA_058360 [Talaromyces stipitatus ATCC 10500]|uniref:DUF7721 domain-containing protein n=1 Tax=Talaromyces stipitatus (strain ATCC 10500 / CBS 375.48 / QM 6759 / NRRL 1006) TaxID=441959 RepID=B8MQE6_TALSN|nr:uncharacterized protein TSTA_058360 [Talaromyces stipitatus ATCC 10500]EED13348.1 hypothetical protein TSTA_058360 [Talaromyces stipitatus ATCC 10500]
MSYGDYQNQGRDQYGDQQYRGNYGASAPDFSDVVNHAENHGGSSSSLFSQAASFLQQRHGDIVNDSPIDEDHVVNSHRRFYGGAAADNAGPASSNELGAGAAMQALKAFTGGGAGGGGQNQLIGLAMAEAEKLFDQQSANGNASGDKQSAINSAAEMALKMYLKGQGTGLGGTGGPSGLLGLASKFF